MGQAKRRGTCEERKAQAIDRAPAEPEHIKRFIRAGDKTLAVVESHDTIMRRLFMTGLVSVALDAMTPPHRRRKW